MLKTKPNLKYFLIIAILIIPLFAGDSKSESRDTAIQENFRRLPRVKLNISPSPSPLPCPSPSIEILTNEVN